MASTYVKYQVFPIDLVSGKHDFANDVFKIALTNTTPNVATHTVLTDIVEITAQNGYTAGGETVSVTATRDDADGVVEGTTVTFIAAGGSFGPFEYAVFYNDTHASKPLIAYWTYPGGSISLLDTEQLTAVFSDAGKIFTVT